MIIHINLQHIINIIHIIINQTKACDFSRQGTGCGVAKKKKIMWGNRSGGFGTELVHIISW